MIQVLITSSALIGVILLLRAVLRKKVSQRLIYALWGLVALRLLVPVQFGQWEFSLINVSQPAAERFQQSVSQPIVGPSREELYQQLLSDYMADNSATAPQITQQVSDQVEAQSLAPSVLDILTVVWIGGVAVTFAFFLISNLLFLRRIRRGSTLWLGETTARVRICPNVPTPCLVGLFRPTVCLPPATLEDDDALRHVLTHELTHRRHLDHIWSLVRCVCLCIYWFDPLVWMAAMASKRDCELACDEAALKRLGDRERIPYGKTLLAIVSQSLRPSHILSTATAMNENKKQLKERMCFIVKKPKKLLICTFSLVLVTALTAGIVFTGCAESSASAPEATAAVQAASIKPDDPASELPHPMETMTKAQNLLGLSYIEFLYASNDTVEDIIRSEKLSEETAQAMRSLSGISQRVLFHKYTKWGNVLALYIPGTDENYQQTFSAPEESIGQEAFDWFFHELRPARIDPDLTVYADLLRVALFQDPELVIEYMSQLEQSDVQWFAALVCNGLSNSEAQLLDTLLVEVAVRYASYNTDTTRQGTVLDAIRSHLLPENVTYPRVYAQGDHYTVTETEPFRFHLSITDASGLSVLEQDCSSVPGVSMVSDQVIRYEIGGKTTYYHLEKDQFSQTYNNAVYSDGVMVLYMTDDMDYREYVYESLFGETHGGHEWFRGHHNDFAPIDDPIIRVELSEDGQFLSYYFWNDRYEAIFGGRFAI